MTPEAVRRFSHIFILRRPEGQAGAAAPNLPRFLLAIAQHDAYDPATRRAHRRWLILPKANNI